MAVVHGLGWHVSLEENTRGRDDLELALEVTGEFFHTLPEPDFACFLVVTRIS